jgi:hypothetical protein
VWSRWKLGVGCGPPTKRQGHTSDESDGDTDMKVTGCLGLSSGIPFEGPSPSVGIFYMPFPGRPGKLAGRP